MIVCEHKWRTYYRGNSVGCTVWEFCTLCEKNGLLVSRKHGGNGHITTYGQDSSMWRRTHN